jgi:hypothetical protein
MGFCMVSFIRGVVTLKVYFKTCDSTVAMGGVSSNNGLESKAEPPIHLLRSTPLAVVQPNSGLND